MRLQIILNWLIVITVWVCFILACNIPLAKAQTTSEPVYVQEFTGANRLLWEGMADSVVDYFTEQIKPDNTPLTKLTSAEQLAQFYSGTATPNLYRVGESGYAVELVPYIASGDCTVRLTCPFEQTDGTTKFLTHTYQYYAAAYTDSACTCNHSLTSTCFPHYYWRVSLEHSLVSGASGTPMPSFPVPSYPSDWKERKFYKHSFPVGTTIGAVHVSIVNHIDRAYLPNGAVLRIDEVGREKNFYYADGYGEFVYYLLVKGLRTGEQSFDNYYRAETFTANVGLGPGGLRDVSRSPVSRCGLYDISWSDGPHRIHNYPSVEKHVPVIAYVRFLLEYDYTDRQLGCDSPYTYRGDSVDRAQACVVYTDHISGSTSCPGGYSLSGSNCSKFISAEYGACSAGSEVNPDDESQCRTRKDSDYVGTAPDYPPGTDPPPQSCPAGQIYNPVTSQCELGGTGSSPGSGSGSGIAPPDWCSDGGMTWYWFTKTCSGANGDPIKEPTSGGDVARIPSWCTAPGMTWYSSTQTCTSSDGAQVSEGPFQNVSLGEAPVAGDNTGTRDISEHGFYEPTYNIDITLEELIEQSIQNWDSDTLRGRLMSFVPPSGTGALPNMCFTISLSDDPFCIDLNPWTAFFNILRGFMYITAGWTAFRIVIGD